MTLRHFRIFISVVKLNSITLAAEELYMSQPAVSLAIKEMEVYYGVRLFDRLSRKIFITDEGRRVYDVALQVVKNVDDLRDEISTGVIQNDLRIGGSMTIGSCYLPQILIDFKKDHQRTSVVSIIDNSSKLIDLILNHKLDLAIIEGPIFSDKLKSIVIRNDNLVLIIASNNPLSQKNIISLSDLQDQNFLLRDKDSGTRKIVDSLFLANNIIIEPKIESVSTISLIEAVRRNIGISIIPKQFLTIVKKDNIIQRNIENMNFERAFTIIYPKNKHPNTMMNDFIECSKRIIIKD